MEKKLEQTPSDCIRVALFGPESTGKTTLAKALSAYYNTCWVPEFARDYLQEKWDTTKEICKKKDIYPIAVGQMALENELAKKANKILFCDTNLLLTEVYARTYFNGWCDQRVVEANKENQYALYFLTDIDVPWVADDLRDRPNQRREMFESFKTALDSRKIDYITLNGSHNERLEKAVARINQFL
jgi:HTH-type transcriptional repressor of NAD biosynthesis genes